MNAQADPRKKRLLAALIVASTLLVGVSEVLGRSSSLEFWKGLCIGLTTVLTVGTFVSARRRD